MPNNRSDMLKRRMLQQKHEQQLFNLPRIDRDYGKEYEEEVEKFTLYEKVLLVAGVILVLGLCMWMKP